MSKTVHQFKKNQNELNLRKTKRVDLRRSDGIVALIISKEGNLKIKGDVYDLSNFGASLVIKKADALLLECIKEVEVEFECSWGPSFRKHFFICWFENHKIEQTRVGLRVDEKNTGTSLGHLEGMVEMPTKYPLVGYIYKDFFFYEKSIVKLLTISQREALIEVLDDEAIFFIGQKIQILFAFHTTNSDKLTGIVHKTTLKDRKLFINVIGLEISKTLELELINHLVQNTDLNLEKIRSAGFNIKKVSNNFRFRYIKSHEEYLEVLELRLKAYYGAGKVSENATREEMAAPLDHISRIMTCYHGDKLIASVAMSFAENESVILDTERPLREGYPKSFPKKTDVIEISRLCTDPDYRRGDVLIRIFQQIYQIFATSDRNYLLTSTDKKLWPLYKGLGFKKTGFSYAHLYLSGINHDIISIHKTIGTAAKNISILRWNYLYRDMTDFMMERKKINPTASVRFKLYIWKIIGYMLGLRGPERY